jgi:hypothetical protein
MADKPRFDAAFASEQPEISEFTFTNLYAWRAAYGFRVSALDSSIILSSERGGKKEFFRPIGGSLADAVAALAKEKVPFVRVAGRDAALVAEASGFRSAEDRDNDDYLYSTKDLVELKGKRYDGKRNFIKKFRRQFAYVYLRLDDRTIRDCLHFQDIWCITKGCDEESLREERDAVQEMCRNFSSFGLCGGVLMVEGKVRAVAIGQRLNSDTMVMHALKGMPDMPGVYQAMQNEFLAREGSAFTYVNMEQDLGIEGLRKSKLSYHPVKMVRKFRVSPR